jgi:hypothetical protein
MAWLVTGSADVTPMQITSWGACSKVSGGLAKWIARMVRSDLLAVVTGHLADRTRTWRSGEALAMFARCNRLW